tara:strand:+ start:164 stop:316 length:153 start_codon:yes stop_codon:yes gene_type:complete
LDLRGLIFGGAGGIEPQPQNLEYYGIYLKDTSRVLLSALLKVKATPNIGL